MAGKMHQPRSLRDRWTQENNELVNDLMQHEGQYALSRDHANVTRCAKEFIKLLRKIQGIPLHADHAELELSVVFNACMCFIAQSQFIEVEQLIKQARERVLKMTGGDADPSDPLVFWRTVLKSVGNTAVHPFVLYLVFLQWAVWLATCQLKAIQEFQEMSPMFESLTGGFEDSCRDKAKEKFYNDPRLVMDPRRLMELLQICTSIAQGAEKLNEGCSSEALSRLQAASTMPGPRALVAYTHFLSGSCFAHMGCPQMALQCYRKALETDSRCLCALYQSTLIYKQLENIKAEIQALRILHSTLLLPSATEAAVAGSHLLSPSLLLPSQSLSALLSVPSALSILCSLALKCVLHDRVPEGVEHYLDLLAALHSEDVHRSQVNAEVSILPKLPRLYLEAGAALLMAHQPADCTALCHEVISTTLELLPDKVVLEEPEERDVAGGKDVKEGEGEGVLATLLWVAAAYLLQGHCFAHLKDWKQAVTHFTRCINLLVKVLFKRRVAGFQPQIPSVDMDVRWGTDLCILQRLKALSLAGRGISFTQMGRLSEALRDLQLSLQVRPEGVGAGLWCGEVLWRLGRRKEAAACWEKTWSLPAEPLAETLPLYAQEHQWGPVLDSTELRQRIQELGPILSP